MDVFKCIEWQFAYLTCHMCLSFESVHLADSQSHQIYSKMNMGNWWWNIQHQAHTGVMIALFMCACDKSHLRNVSGNQDLWPLHFIIGNIHQVMCCTPAMYAWILVGQIQCLAKGAKKTDIAWHSTVGTVLSLLCSLGIPGSSLKWNGADGFQRQYYSLLAAWVRDYPEQVMFAQVSYGSCLMGEISNGVLMGYSPFSPPNNSTDQNVELELLDKTYIDVVRTLGVLPNQNQLWKFLLCCRWTTLVMLWCGAVALSAALWH